MRLLVLSLEQGEMVQIGDGPEDGVVVRVDERSGRRVRLVFATALPITQLGRGIIPPRWAPPGITEKRGPRILEDVSAARA